MISKFGIKNILGIIVGIGFIVSSALTFIHKEALIHNGAETTAVVTETKYLRRGNSAVYVDYTLEGVTYHQRLPIRYSDRYCGEEVVILYNPDNPQDITPKERDKATDNTSSLILYAAIGLLVIIISISLGRSNVVKSRFRTRKVY